MAKGDYVIVRSEIGGTLVENRIAVEQNGGSIDVSDSDRNGKVVITLLNRNDKPTGKVVTFYPGSVRSIEEKLTRDE